MEFELVQPSFVQDLSRRRFVFVTGKGGVGKTMISAALAKALAAHGKRVLIAMCHTKERLSAILGTPPIHDDVVKVSDNVWSVNISPEKALEEYGAMVLRMKIIASAVFDNKYTKAFFQAVPGLYEWAMLGKAWYHTTEKSPDGGARFDIVMLDAPATGHGVDMLRVPKVILDVVPPGVLRRDAEIAWEMFQDPSKSGVLVVTLPEEMPATESLELIHEIRDELKLPVLRLVANCVLPPLFSEHERKQLISDRGLLNIDAPLEFSGTSKGALVAGARRAVREQIQAESLARLDEQAGVSMLTLPFLFQDAHTSRAVNVLSAQLMKL